MKQDMTLFADDAPIVTATVAVMQCSTVARINPAPIADLYAGLGPDGAEDTICRVLEDIATRLAELERLRCHGHFEAMPRLGQRIASIADQIGLIEVTLAASGVADTAAQEDPIALEATLARLDRSFDAAIRQIWDVQQGA